MKAKTSIPIRSTNNEHILLRPHAIHFGKNLVDHTIRSSTSVADVATTRFGNRIQLIEEKHTRRGSASL